MAAHEEDTTGGNRATVAGLYEKVDGLKALLSAFRADMQRQLNLISGVPAKQARLEARVSSLEDRVHDLEADDGRRRAAFPGTLISLALLALTAVNVYFFVKYGTHVTK